MDDDVIAQRISMKTYLKAIVLMSRPLILVSTFFSWFLGVSIAIGTSNTVSIISILFGFTSMLFISASIHLVNEYVDYETDALTNRTTYSGGSGVLPSKIVPRFVAFYSALFFGAIGLGLECFAISRGNHIYEALPIAFIGLIGGWLYSLPPVKLAWRGFGELDNALLGAFLLPFWGYIQVSTVFELKVLVLIFPLTLLAFNNLLAVTWIDREADNLVRKKTLATLVDPIVLRIIHGIMLISSFIWLFVLDLLPRIILWLSIPGYLLMIHGWITYTKKEISLGTIWGLHVYIVLQSLGWLYIRANV